MRTLKNRLIRGTVGPGATWETCVAMPSGYLLDYSDVIRMLIVVNLFTTI